MLKRIATAAVLAASLMLMMAGCAKELQQAGTFVQTIATATVPQEVFIGARVAFNTAQAGATNVLRLRLCNGSNGPVCREASWTPRIRTAIYKGREARDRLTRLMKANPNGNVPVADYNTMVESTTIINDIIAAVRGAQGR